MTEPVTTPPAARAATSGTAPRSFGPRTRWVAFFGLAFGVIVIDQLAKLAVTSNLDPGQSIQVIGDYLRIVFGQNSGALFGLFKDNAAMFGIVSIAVVALIVIYQARSGGNAYLTITLGLLLGGAVGNMLDRLRLGYVVDFVDVGIGDVRFYTFNVADSAISLAILLLFIAALRPSLVEGAPPAEARSRERSTSPLHEGEEDPWDEDDPVAPADEVATADEVAAHDEVGAAGGPENLP